MSKVIILHGTLGSPEGNWFLWLKAELERRGASVWAPQLPQSEQPSLDAWRRYISENSPFELDNDTMIIGHSSGAIAALIVSQNSTVALKAIVCVSVFHDNSLNWEPNDNLFDIAFDWSAIRQGAKKILFIHSDNDPYVPLAQARLVATNTGGELVVISGEGHFNLEQSDSYTRFPRLIDILGERNLLP